MKFLIFTAFILAYLSAFPQGSDSIGLRQRYENETIYLTGGRYIKANEAIPFQFIIMEKEFSFSEQAYKEFKQAAMNFKSSKRSTTIALVLSAAAIVLISTEQNQEAIVPLGGAAIATGFSVHYSRLGSKSFQKALWLRNRDVLLENQLYDTLGLRSRYEDETIYRYGGRYLKGNQSIRPRYKTLEKEFLLSDEGYKEFKLAETDSRKSRPSAYLGIGLLITSIILAKNHYGTASFIAFGAAVVTLPISNQFHLRSAKRFQRALWMRNRDAILR